MRILFIYKEDYPWDVRVEKIARTLATAGHEVTVLSRNCKRRSTIDNSNGFAIMRMPALPRWLGPLNQIFGLPHFFNFFWTFFIWRAAKQTESDLIIVRDLPLMLNALAVKHLLERPVVFDMAECYPEMYRAIQLFGRNKTMSWIVKNPAFTRLLESAAVKGADHVLVMIEESRNRLLALGTAADKVTIVSNTPLQSDTGPREHVDSKVVRFLYVGYVTRIRGLDNFLRGLRHFVTHGDGKSVPEFNVVGVGDALQEYRQLARVLGIEAYVRFHGWCDQPFVDDLYSRSDVGILTYRVCGHWNHTIPNKLFDYMRSGMPVLATDVIPIKRIVEDIQCGVIVKDGDDESCSNGIAKLCDARFRAQLGKRGYEAVRSRYNWADDEKRLNGVIDAHRPDSRRP